MKTTLVSADSVMARVKREAAKRGCTMSEFVESALRQAFARKPELRPLPELPIFSSGGMAVDPADREALYDFFDRDPGTEP